MRFAKWGRNLTACIIICWIVGCSSPSSIGRIGHSEAVKARLELALAYLAEAHYAKAKENIDRAMMHDSQDYLPYSVLAYYYQSLNEYDKADKAYQMALKLSQKQSHSQKASPDVLNNYGTFLCKLGQFDKSYRLFEQALQSELPYYAQVETLENFIKCATQAGRMDLVKANLAKLAVLDKNRADFLK